MCHQHWFNPAGMYLIMDKAGAITAKEVGILTEGDRAEWRDICWVTCRLFWRRKVFNLQRSGTKI